MIDYLLACAVLLTIQSFKVGILFYRLFKQIWSDVSAQGIHLAQAKSLTSKFLLLIGGTNGVLLAAYVKVKICSRRYICGLTLIWCLLVFFQRLESVGSYLLYKTSLSCWFRFLSRHFGQLTILWNQSSLHLLPPIHCGGPIPNQHSHGILVLEPKWCQLGNQRIWQSRRTSVCGIFREVWFRRWSWSDLQVSTRFGSYFSKDGSKSAITGGMFKGERGSERGRWQQDFSYESCAHLAFKVDQSAIRVRGDYS